MIDSGKPVYAYFFRCSISPASRASSISALSSSPCSNTVSCGSPSRIRSVRRISLGITTRPSSSILRTIPVARTKCCLLHSFLPAWLQPVRQARRAISVGDRRQHAGCFGFPSMGCPPGIMHLCPVGIDGTGAAQKNALRSRSSSAAECVHRFYPDYSICMAIAAAPSAAEPRGAITCMPGQAERQIAAASSRIAA